MNNLNYVEFGHNTFSMEIFHRDMELLRNGKTLYNLSYNLMIRPHGNEYRVIKKNNVESQSESLWYHVFIYSADSSQKITYEYIFKGVIIENYIVVIESESSQFSGDLRYFKEIDVINFKPLKINKIHIQDSSVTEPIQYVRYMMQQNEPIDVKLISHCVIDGIPYKDHPGIPFTINQYNLAVNALKLPSQRDANNIKYLNTIIEQCKRNLL